MRPRSFNRVTAPSASVLTITSANSSGVWRRPWALTESWRSTPSAPGDWPTTPAAAWMFWARIAATTSAAERPRSATFCGSSQIRIA